MRIVAVVGPSQARGLRLAGFEAFEDADARSAKERVRALARQSDIGLLLLSRRIAHADPSVLAGMSRAEPPLAVVIPDPEDP